ncbi:MAG: hypothetical protein AAGD25_40000 [Cyanobacteria bacterium P01_F01_bin.150]
MEEKKTSQSISISGSSLSGVQIGGQAGNDLTASQYQQVGEGVSDKIPTPDDVANLLDQLKKLLQVSELPEEDKAIVIRKIENAEEEVKAEEPDKEFAAKNLQKATKVLKEAGETVEAGTSLWEKVKPIFEAVSPWLGVAISFLI